jgi:hypothetical protein
MSYNSKYTGQEVENILSLATTEERVRQLLNENRFKAFIIEDVTVNGVLYKAGSVIDLIADELDIQPTSNNSISGLFAYPGALSWQDWLEGV